VFVTVRRWANRLEPSSTGIANMCCCCSVVPVPQAESHHHHHDDDDVSIRNRKKKYRRPSHFHGPIYHSGGVESRTSGWAGGSRDGLVLLCPVVVLTLTRDSDSSCGADRRTNGGGCHLPISDGRQQQQPEQRPSCTWMQTDRPIMRADGDGAGER
jgi:hypothetical protein